MDYLPQLADRDIATKADVRDLEAKLTARIDALNERLDWILIVIILVLVWALAGTF